ncbi:AraC-like ligand-binding domain-containing protein [Streptomyces sp. NPDC055210]
MGAYGVPPGWGIRAPVSLARRNQAGSARAEEHRPTTGSRIAVSAAPLPALAASTRYSLRVTPCQARHDDTGLMDVTGTAEVPAGERFAFWREVNAKLLVPYDFKLGCFVRGGGTMTKDAQHTVFRAGDMTLYDPSYPYLAEFAVDVSMRQLLLLRFPRSLLPFPAQDLRRLSTVRIPGTHGIGAISSQFLLHLARHMRELSPADTARLSSVGPECRTLTSVRGATFQA